MTQAVVRSDGGRPPPPKRNGDLPSADSKALSESAPAPPTPDLSAPYSTAARPVVPTADGDAQRRDDRLSGQTAYPQQV